MHIADQTVVFFQSILVGGLLGLLYDVFRITRIAFSTHTIVVFIEDVVFFLCCAVVTFSLMMSALDGNVRYFLIAGEIIGAVLYFVTISILVMKVSKTIINIIKKIIGFFIKYIFLPIWRICYTFVVVFTKPFKILFSLFKKIFQKAIFRLKVRRLLLYNHFRQNLHKKKTKIKQESSE